VPVQGCTLPFLLINVDFFGILIIKSLIPHHDTSEICFIKVLKNDDLQENTAILIKAEITTF